MTSIDIYCLGISLQGQSGFILRFRHGNLGQIPLKLLCPFQYKYPVSPQKKLIDKLTHQTYLSYAVDIQVNNGIVYVSHPALPPIEDINYGTL
jgi:hypothetical protein